MGLTGEHYPLVSIITLNWNGLRETLEFLDSTRRLTYPSYEILVCDMNSDSDPTKDLEGTGIPALRVLRSNRNLGYAGGNNWGMRQAKGDYFLIVNNDTVLTADFLEKMLLPFQRNESIGFVCPKIKYYDNPDVIQFAGYNPFNLFTGRSSSIGKGEADQGQFDQGGYTNMAHGCAMMVPKRVVEVVGKFPEEFFLYYEELDWSLRMIRAGYRIYYQPEAVIYHKESMSVGKNSPLKVYYMARNRILLVRRHASRLQKWFFFGFFMLFAFPAGMFRHLINGRFLHLKAFVRGVIWNFGHKSQCTIV